jgi:hypothetical protein
VGVVPEDLAQVDNDRRDHLVHYFFDSFRGPSHHDRPVSLPSPSPVFSGDGFNRYNKCFRDEKQWSCLSTLTGDVKHSFFIFLKVEKRKKFGKKIAKKEAKDMTTTPAQMSKQ